MWSERDRVCTLLPFDARDDGIAIITLNRPDTRKALSSEIREGLFAAWERFERTPELRVAILTGAGEKAFCAGGDLKEMVETRLKVPSRNMFPPPYDTIELSKPTIAAINGVAFVGGWMIAQACDLCVAITARRTARETVMVSTEMGRSAALQAARHASEYGYNSDDAQSTRPI
jgi:enoyl-CoA hydratase